MFSSAESPTSPTPGSTQPLPSRRLPVAIVGSLIALWSVRVSLVWNQLPPVMASHFGADGTANGWMSKSGFFLFDLGMTLGLSALFLFAPSWLRHMPPDMVNLPAADYWLAPQRVEASLRRIGPWMAWLAVGTTGFILGISDLALRTNLKDVGLIDGPLVRLLVGAFLSAIVIWSVLFYRAFRRPRET